jgi:hypothetical protein
VWDAVRCCWIEAATICRDAIGRFANKNGSEPSSQLVLDFGKETD